VFVLVYVEADGGFLSRKLGSSIIKEQKKSWL
jgi:hypothetical protein